MGQKKRANPRMTLQTVLVLRALLTDPTNPRYGLELATETLLPTGTIYPILARLEAARWVVSSWENVGSGQGGDDHAAAAASADGRWGHAGAGRDHRNAASADAPAMAAGGRAVAARG